MRSRFEFLCSESWIFMQAVLERVGSVTETRSSGVPDWRRRPEPDLTISRACLSGLAQRCLKASANAAQCSYLGPWC